MKQNFPAAMLVAAVAALAPMLVFAQNYPVKPVRILIPWPPGGANDVVGRIVAQRMTEQLGQQVIVENRGGASGTIGSDLVAKGPADGYTVMVHSATHVANPHLYKKLPYDTLKDFTGVTALAVQVGMLVVHPSLPVKSVKEFIALGKARPGELVYGSSGSGSFVHLAMALLNSMTNTKMIHVPYKGGGPATIALASGEIQAMTATIGSLIPHIESKRIRPLGVTSAKRVKQYPDVPAIAEGVPGYEFVAWIGSFVAAGTPRPIVDRLNAEFRKALAHPDAARILGAQTLDPLPMSPEEFSRLLKTDYDKYEKVIKLSGAQLD
ncbi:MAG TPA: tripartite tricarboxylate transporter substrate binding protein [Burkholderiales bacterium]|nr:tripartite tricarboxylate transporter substrate binding protein [Burkholderiales bacterium]